jgi:hypothetical protein
MRKIAIWLLPGFLLLMAGCVSSVHPLYTAQDVIFDPTVLGVWTDEDSKETWALTRAGEKEYKLIHTDEDGRKGEFVAYLLNVKGQMFLDLYPVEPEHRQSSFYHDHLLRVHKFVAVFQIEPTIRISYLDPEWLKKFLDMYPSALKAEKVEGEVLITASPEETQKFLLAHLKTEGAFSEQCELVRSGRPQGR